VGFALHVRGLGCIRNGIIDGYVWNAIGAIISRSLASISTAEEVCSFGKNGCDYMEISLWKTIVAFTLSIPGRKIKDTLKRTVCVSDNHVE
jgi:hypothetical protein